VGIGVPSRRSGALRTTTGPPSRSRTTTSNSPRGLRPRSAATASTSSSGVAVGDMATKRTIAGVQPVTRPPRWLLAHAIAVLLLTLSVAGAGRVGAQEITEPSACAGSPETDTVFVGRVTTIEDGLVTFAVSEVRSGSVAHQTIAVRYPTRYNARELEVGDDYLVPLVDPTGVPALGVPRSFVDTAEIESCRSRGTVHVDGSPIDTGAFAGVGHTVATYGVWTAVAVVALLVLLVVLGRFLDRRSRYAKAVRI
jgi:hypothetical protein